MSKPRESVPLPNPKPDVDLAPEPARVLRALINAGAQGVTTLELLELGCVTPKNTIYQLRRLGAVIDTQYCQATGRKGTTHSGIARYVFRYWNPECDNTNLNYDLKETA